MKVVGNTKPHVPRKTLATHHLAPRYHPTIAALSHIAYTPLAIPAPHGQLRVPTADMELSGDHLLEVLRTTTTNVKLLDEAYRLLGLLSPGQALLLAESGQFSGGGSTNRVRYMRYFPRKMTATQQSFCDAHQLPAYDPTYFRTFAGFLRDQTSFSGMRRTKIGKKPKLQKGDNEE